MPQPPSFPALACDAHCHLFGPAARFPFSPKRPYTPEDATLEQYEALQEWLGLSRAVFVQPACHGGDHAAMLDALARGEGRYRGVGLLATDVPMSALEGLDRAGVRGARFNFVGHLGQAPDKDALRAFCHRIADLGWHLVLHVDQASLAVVGALVDGLPLPFVIDHFARIDAAGGTAQPAFQELLRLQQDARCWVKISAADRISLPPYDDAVPLAQALIAGAPDRILWGTDWPHPNVWHLPEDLDLKQLLWRFVPDTRLREAILVDNPQRLYRFG